MATKQAIHPNHHKSIHQHIEHMLRHKMLLTLIVGAVMLAVAHTDSRFRELMRNTYTEGISFVSSHFTHEHPSHHHNSTLVARMPTVSGQ